MLRIGESPTIGALIPGAPGGPSGSFEKYPHLFPPPGFIQVDRNGLLVSGGANGVLETILLTSGYHGWIRTIALESSDFTLSAFQILSGNSPMRDYTNITVNLGSTATPKPVFIELFPNVPLTLQYTSIGLASLRWNLWGWYYPER